LLYKQKLRLEYQSQALSKVTMFQPKINLAAPPLFSADDGPESVDAVMHVRAAVGNLDEDSEMR